LKFQRLEKCSPQRGFLRAQFLGAPALAVAGVILIALWLEGVAPAHLARREPLPENTGAVLTPTATGSKAAPETLTTGPGKPSNLAGSWPQFRGPDRSAFAAEESGLARKWPAQGPRVLWSLDVGEGHAGAAVSEGRVYLLDYDREKKQDAVRCLSLDDGREIWRYSYPVELKRNHGMSRTVPAVGEGYVVTLGPKCHVHCLDAKTGRLAWKIDLVGEYGAVVPPWYAGQCPLIDRGAAILAPGGESLMLAVELATGRILWKTPNPDKWDMTHSSIMKMDYKGISQYICCFSGGVAAVSASDGRVLWKKLDWKIELANVPSPVVVGGDLVFFTGGYNSGCVLVRLIGEAGDIKTEEVFRLPSTVFASDQQTPIFHGGHIYGVIPGGQMACLDLSGKRLWESGTTRRFGLGPFMIADGLILALNDQDGMLRLAEAASDQYRELASAKALDGHDAWAPMALVAGRLILRDLTRMVCLELPRGE